ncbi:hypothetical protein NQZ79_g763 [Umbelopsis isabellina]|nr:hypothetical protein NQZ79_g763 [Umbelopsis isabellina]
MFNHGWSNYMKHAYPMDELNPFNCSGRGSDKWDPTNININDVLGDYGVTLIDTLDTLAIMGEREEFENAINLVARNVSFDQNSRVQVFETNIRTLGGLLSAHILASDNRFDYKVKGYNGELLESAVDLAQRLIPAFQMSRTGIPYPRVNLRYGVSKAETLETCTAGAGSLLLEFGILSRLTGDPFYETLQTVAKNSLKALWERKSEIGLLGNTINLQTGQWLYTGSSVGAGVDSIFEYMFKAYVLFGDDDYSDMFEEAYSAVMHYVVDTSGYLYRNVDMKTAQIMSHWIDSLSAFWPGLQVLYGDLEMAIKSHLTFYNVWKKYQGLPERYNFALDDVEIGFYPLRPEFAESTYFLYRATKDPFYLKVGEMILNDINERARLRCGFATISDVRTGELQDRMESFVLSETFKYLYLLFDTEHPLNYMDNSFVFTTEGHIMPMPENIPATSVSAASSKNAGKSKQKLRDTCMSYSALQRKWESDSPHRQSQSLSLDLPLQPIADFAHFIVRSPVSNETFPLIAGGYCSDPNLHSPTFQLKFDGAGDSRWRAPNILKIIDGLFTSSLAGLDIEFKKAHRGREGYDVTRGAAYTFGTRLSAGQNFQIPLQAVQPYFTSDLLGLGYHFSTGAILQLRDDSASSDFVVLHVGSSQGLSNQQIIAARALFGSRSQSFKATDLIMFDPRSDAFSACSDYSYEEEEIVDGKVVMVGRSYCNFHEQALKAQEAGAIGIIMVNAEQNKVFNAGGIPSLKGQIYIPCFMISLEDASELLGYRMNHVFPLRIPDVKFLDFPRSQLSFDTKLIIKGSTVHNIVLL